MKIAVRYQSKSGNTAKVAQAIAKELGVEASGVDVPLAEDVDLLFVGGAIYAGNLSRHLKKFLKDLRPGQAKNIALFSTAASESHISGKAAKFLKDNDATVYGEEFHAQPNGLDAALPDAAAFAKKAVGELAG